MSWNLYHGRDFPPDPGLRTWRSRLLRTSERNATHVQVNRSLRKEFADLLAELDWDVALLQEAPPRWRAELSERAGAGSAMALTSRNLLGAVRGALADWNPDLIASNEGGSNQLLVRRPARIAETRSLALARFPERRRMLWARLELPGGRALAVANLHASAGRERTAGPEVLEAASRAVGWAGSDPLVFGGDLNLRPETSPAVFAQLRERYGLAAPTAPNAIDHVLARGLALVEPPRRLPPERRELIDGDGLRIRLSDHAPVTVCFSMK